MYTFYSKYAAICGCKSIVVPEAGMDINGWQPKEEFRYGVAYGEKDLPWALSTRSKLVDYLKKEQQRTLFKVAQFAKECITFFHDQTDF